MGCVVCLHATVRVFPIFTETGGQPVHVRRVLLKGVGVGVGGSRGGGGLKFVPLFSLH